MVFQTWLCVYIFSSLRIHMDVNMLTVGMNRIWWLTWQMDMYVGVSWLGLELAWLASSEPCFLCRTEWDRIQDYLTERIPQWGGKLPLKCNNVLGDEYSWVESRKYVFRERDNFSDAKFKRSTFNMQPLTKMSGKNEKRGVIFGIGSRRAFLVCLWCWSAYIMRVTTVFKCYDQHVGLRFR
jgi:hypothetical protein